MNRFYLHFIFIFCSIALAAQTPVLRPQSSQALGGAKMTVVLQDSHGWLWCGAEKGLFRFDGLSFQTIGLADTFSKANVTALFESQGQIWAGFSNGAIGRVSIAGNFQPALTGDAEAEKKYAPYLMLWQIEEGLPSEKITAFAEDKSGGLWIATYGEGLYVWKNNRLYQFNASDDGLASNDIYALASDAQGRIWAATDAGISLCAMPEMGKKQIQNLGISDGLPDEIVTALLADDRGNVWVGTQEKGIVQFDVATLRPVFMTQNWAFGDVTSLAIFGSRELWVGTGRDGLIRIDLAYGKAQALPETHAFRRTRSHALCKDREGLLWAVLDKGVLYSANVHFGLWQPGFTNVQALLTDQKGRFWAGSQSGLFLQNVSRNAVPVYMKTNDRNSVPVYMKTNDRNSVPVYSDFKNVLLQNVISLWQSPSGEIWAGTFGNGVFVLDQQGRVLRQYSERHGLANGSVLSIGGRGQTVWLATLGGVSAIGVDGKGTLQVQPELGTSYVYKVFTDSRGRVWFGTDGKGLAVLENDALRFFTTANGTELKTIYSITEDRRGRIWFSTDRAGLFCLDGNEFQRFTTANGLHSQHITGLTVDGNGLIVIGYEEGFDLLNPERVNHLMFCDASIGAPKASINLNAMCRDTLGNVWLGTKDGIVRLAAFDEKFVDDPQPGITSVSVLLKSVDFLSTSTFSHSDNYFIFNFAGLWFTNPESVSYRYKLEGFDPDWKVSKDHLASYPSLQPGKYTFRVQTSEHENFEKVPEASWSFVIQRPFWQQWWFVLLSLITGTGLIMAFVRSREASLRREAQLKRERVESQFEALKSQINPHFLFNSFNTLITIIEENPRIAVEYVEHLSDFYRNIIVYRERDFISLQEEMELVKSFSFLLQKRYEAGFRLASSLNGQTGQVMPLALQMLVENAVKHNVISASKPLTVEIFSEHDGYVTVRNNIQKKIKPEPSTRFGLQSLINRYQLLGERPVIVEDNGAFFTVKVPIVDR
ncbi:MAG: two-component regulator propeller domain-containing protein [Saprospiraceae bacterium]|nr:two-component regulator propeller domain-containing protein [Saprospiraceae bacterium]